ncbi:Predicted kinase, aminoglycoside phosphotransferase (APT) family [Halogeometricum rufum]|uniref:Predicted kinase, aminoglycoside phosphotransferase (APT) family n=1 Tax=Halogeometricum rufum TaxID=553469 RepID=A0A1I6J9W3_9EURY|nr:phosphotransferase [Halogeometricum rufum]SFR75731.1 Predicted kinase, aminoglycoside phosphotransferase (APT) family [Halogeometricum rufum]
MLPSLGYVTELEQAAERESAERRSEMTVGEPEARRAARRTFPDASSIAVHGDSTAGDGGVTFAFAVRDHDATYVLKFAPEEKAAQLQRGAAAYRHLDARTSVPVPGTVTVEPDGCDLPYPYSVVEHVGGDELSSIGQFRSFPRGRKRAVVREMGRALGTLHAQTAFERYGSVSGRSGALTVDDRVADWRAHYRRRYEEYADAARESPVSDLADRAVECFERMSDLVRPESGPVLLHGDFTPDNLITRDGTVRAVLDWEHAEAGCGAKELREVEENVVEIARRDEVRSDLRDALLDGYAAARPVSDAFLATKAVFGVGEFARVGAVRSFLAAGDEFDDAAFRTRAERELDARIEAAESRLDRL